MRIFTLYLIFFLAFACEKSRKSDELTSRVSIDLVANNDASDLGNGTGEITVSSSEDIKVECTNCGPQFKLNFEPSSEEDLKTHTSNFVFPYVEKTYLCRLSIKVTMLKDSKQKTIDYGLYLCPKDQSGNSVCDFESALETCRLNNE